jgi:hypothetical protein
VQGIPLSAHSGKRDIKLAADGTETFQLRAQRTGRGTIRAPSLGLLRLR